MRLGRAGLTTMGIVLSFTGTAAAEDGLSALSARVAQEPANGSLLLRRASLHKKNGDIEAALADLELALSLPGGGALAAVRAGLMLAEAGRHEAAAERFDAALARAPRNPAARAGNATALWNLGERAQATALFEALLADADDPAIFADYAHLLATARRPNSAVEVLDRGLLRFGALPSLTFPLIELEVRLGRFDAALRHLDDLLAESSRRDYLLMRRGDVLAHAGRRCQAQDAYRQALLALDGLSDELSKLATFQDARAQVEERLQEGRGLHCERLRDRATRPRRPSPGTEDRRW